MDENKITFTKKYTCAYEHAVKKTMLPCLLTAYVISRLWLSFIITLKVNLAMSGKRSIIVSGNRQCLNEQL